MMHSLVLHRGKGRSQRIREEGERNTHSCCMWYRWGIKGFAHAAHREGGEGGRGSAGSDKKDIQSSCAQGMVERAGGGGERNESEDRVKGCEGGGRQRRDGRGAEETGAGGGGSSRGQGEWGHRETLGASDVLIDL